MDILVWLVLFGRVLLGPPLIGSAAHTAPCDALAVLDERRALAFAVGDEGWLDRVYVPGSSAGGHDAATLRAYRSRGLRVLGAHLHIEACAVTERTQHAAELAVVDRLADSVAVDAKGEVTALPRDRPTARHLHLVVRDGQWRIG